MLRHAVFVLIGVLCACERDRSSPPKLLPQVPSSGEHRIEYMTGGLGDHGPITYEITIDLDTRQFWASTPDGATKGTVSPQDIVELQRLAAATRAEPEAPKNPTFDVMDALTFDGSDHRVISQRGPITTTHAQELEAKLRSIGHWSWKL